jgi:hypothetical protein
MDVLFVTCLIKTYTVIDEIKTASNEYFCEISVRYPYIDDHGLQINPLQPQNCGMGENQVENENEMVQGPCAHLQLHERARL